MTCSIVSNADYPSAYSNWLQLFLNYDSEFKEVVLTGNDAARKAKEINASYIPNILLAFAEGNSQIPLVEGKHQPNKNLFYICQNKSCSAPNSDFNELMAAIK